MAGRDDFYEHDMIIRRSREAEGAPEETSKAVEFDYLRGCHTPPQANALRYGARSLEQAEKDMEAANARIDKLAGEVMNLARNTLQVNLRFLDSAIGSLKLKQYEGTMAVDGETLFYDPVYVLRRYRLSRENPARDFLHEIFHCVFHHAFVGPEMDQELWNLACDIAVENAITDLNIPAVKASREAEQIRDLEGFKEKVKMMSAERIYHYLREETPPADELNRLLKLFTNDDHTNWYAPKDTVEDIESKVEKDNTEAQFENENKRLKFGDSEGDRDEETDQEQETGENEGSEASGSPDEKGDIEKHWDEIAKQMQTDLETFSREMGDQKGGTIQSLKAVNRERYDYTRFLKKFAAMGESLKVNDDEFDYIFYTYGMKLYGRMPLIEPLEYKEELRIRDFVIAIDTSGSVSGPLVEKFVTKTYNILNERESFFSKINLHIIQCDSDIQEDKKITSREEFNEYIKTMKLKGFGGTDFRPVFDYVDRLNREHKFTNLKGLIYFTDGYGVFPAKKPDYQTAFVFVDDEYNNPDVPVWAIKLVLQSDEV